MTAITILNPQTGQNIHIWGGSFFKAPDNDALTKINLMAECDLPSDIYFPIRDYSVPENSEDLIKVFEECFAKNKDIYVGCFGGIGRTGLFMGALLKYLGHPHPIDFIRSHHHPHSCETEDQVAFVESFPLRPTFSPSLFKP